MGLRRRAGAYEDGGVVNACSVRKHSESRASIYGEGGWIPKKYGFFPASKGSGQEFMEANRLPNLGTWGRRSEKLATSHNPSTYKTWTSEMWAAPRDQFLRRGN